MDGQRHGEGHEHKHTPLTHVHALI